VRVPSHPVAHALLQQVGRPVAAPSANRSGRVSPTTAAHVLEELDGRIAAILESGPCQVGIESTVLDLTTPSPVLLRPGGVALEELESVLGPIQIATADASAGDAPRSPGMLTSHYAPTHAVRLNADAVSATEGLLAFGPPLVGAAKMFQLSAGRDTTEAAARLFEGLRYLDGIADLTAIAVMPIPQSGLGRAINDRLRRAAAPR
jgi:L-threonylcarbamoyladenylate synthase